MLTIKELFQNICALKFAFDSLFARIAAGIAQLYGIRVFLGNYSQDEYSTIIIVLGLSPIFLLFEFGISQTIQNIFNQRKCSAASIIKIMMFHYIIILFIGLALSQSVFIPALVLNESLLNATNIQIFTIGSMLLVISSNNVILHKVLLLLRKGQLINILILVTSVMQILGLYIYNKIGASNPVFSIIIFLSPILFISFVALVWIGAIAFTKKTIDKSFVKNNFFKTSSSFFIINIMLALLLTLDYIVLSFYGATNQIASYHTVNRFFLISYTLYASYLNFAAKKISNTKQISIIHQVRISTNLIGTICVTGVFVLLVILKETKGINLISDNLVLSYALLFSGFIYFLIRVFADTNILLAKNQSQKGLAFMVYFIEILLASILMVYFFPIYGEISLFISLAIAYSIGNLFYLMLVKK